MKNVPTTSEREEMRRPSVENFQRLWDSLISYNDVHTTMMFYPKKRETRPKAVFFPQASPKDVYDYFIHGLIDSLYFHNSNPRELQEFPPKVQNAIKVYNDHFAKGRELYLKMHSSFLIFYRERKLVVPSITIAQLGSIYRIIKEQRLSEIHREDHRSDIGLEGDEEGLLDVLVKLETSLDEVFCPCDAAAYTRRNKKIMTLAPDEIPQAVLADIYQELHDTIMNTVPKELTYQ
ncbi:hypothetical protein Tco_0210752 [Tanacetum coccineum]